MENSRNMNLILVENILLFVIVVKIFCLMEWLFQRSVSILGFKPIPQCASKICTLTRYPVSYHRDMQYTDVENGE